MTDKKPERIWINLDATWDGTINPKYGTGDLTPFINADLHAAVVAERDQLKTECRKQDIAIIEWEQKWIETVGFTEASPEAAQVRVKALRELVELVADEVGIDKFEQADDESVGWDGTGQPLSMTFGHVRRAQSELENLSALEQPKLAPVLEILPGGEND